MQEQQAKQTEERPEPFPGFEQVAKEMLETWQVPGLAIGIIKHDRLLFAQGYGVRRVGAPEPVTAQTIFATGSVTKPLTALAVGILVDEGKVQWDDPVIKHLPHFQLSDPYVTKHLTIRDLLCARSGLQGGQLMVYAEDSEPATIIHRLRYLKPLTGFRLRPMEHTFHFFIAGQLLEAVSHQSWNDFVRERLLRPLTMSSSSTRFAETQRASDLATPHVFLHDQIVPMPWYNMDHLRGAGGLNANIVDLAQWVRFLLQEGTYQGQQLVSREVMHELFTPQIVDHSPPTRSLNPEAHLVTYGLGWYVYDYQGYRVVEHGGSPFGMHALIAMVPHEQLGLVLLTNTSSRREMLAALKLQIVDHYLARPPRNWSTEYMQIWREAEARQQAARIRASEDLAAQRIKDTRPSLVLEQYAGVYENALYGKARIVLEQGQLHFQYGAALQAELRHWHYDTFQATWRAPFFGDDLFTFSLDAWGKVAHLTTPDFGTFQRV